MASRLADLIRNPRERDYYLIGETAHNHAGDYAYAERVVDDLCGMDVDAIKIHMNLVLASYASKDFKEVEVYEKFVWTADQYGALLDRVKTSGKELIVLANDMESLDYLIGRGDIDGIELHAVSMYDVPMLERLNDYDGVVVLGVGGTEMEEIQAALNRLQQDREPDILFMYGYQNFPSDPAKVNLRRMMKIRELFGIETGYADHTIHDHPDNVWITTLGYAAGCRVLEKHYTPDHGVERIDYESSVGKPHFAALKEKLDLVRAVLGDGRLTMSDEEKAYGQYGVMKKAIVASRDIPAGTVLAAGDMNFKRTSIPRKGRQLDFDTMLGRVARVDIPFDEMIDFSMLEAAGEP